MSSVRLHVLAGLSASPCVCFVLFCRHGKLFMTLDMKRCFRNVFPLNFLRRGGSGRLLLAECVCDTPCPPGCSCFLLHVGISLSVFCFSADQSSCSGCCAVPSQLSQWGSSDPALTVSRAAPLDGMWKLRHGRGSPIIINCQRSPTGTVLLLPCRFVSARC